MATKIKIDKRTWGDGPWQSEPDRVEWPYAGYWCLIIRNPGLGHLCGYVGVDKGSPYYGKDYKDVDVDVHKGLTYSGKLSGIVCDYVWWLGFDCDRLYDLCPGLGTVADIENTYRTLDYVKAQTESLADQIRRV